MPRKQAERQLCHHPRQANRAEKHLFHQATPSARITERAMAAIEPIITGRYSMLCAAPVPAPGHAGSMARQRNNAVRIRCTKNAEVQAQQVGVAR